MNNNEGKFSSGFLMGLIIGGGAVFLLGTRTGKNLLRIISEQGLDGIATLLEEYDVSSLEEEEESPSYEESSQEDKEEVSSEPKNESPKKRFFKRLKK